MPQKETTKLPALQFYVGDWRKDPGVQALSYHDRGVWFEILCLMHESEQRGKLLLNGKPMPEEALARLLGLDKQILTKTLTTIIEYGVASRDEDTGVLYNRRMVRDEEIRQIRTEAGKKGGNPNLVNQKSNQKPTTRDNQKSTPSSSVSTSKKSTPNGDADASGKVVDIIWDLGVRVLTKGGMNERNARTLLGSLAQKHGKDSLSVAIARTSSANPADPQGYLVKLLKKRAGPSPEALNDALSATDLDAMLNRKEPNVRAHA